MREIPNPVSSFDAKSNVSIPNHSFSGSTFKLLKACNFCRKRKIKCKVLSNNICENCKEHNRECIFDHKAIARENKVKKPTSITINLKDTIANKPKNLSSYTGTFLDQIDSNAMEEFNKTINSPEYYKNSESDPLMWTSDVKLDTASMSQPTLQNNNDVFQIYVENIEPYTPFLSHDIFNEELDAFSISCIQVAAVSSTNSLMPQPSISYLLEILHTHFTKPIEWDPIKLGCFFLLPLRIRVPKPLIIESVQAFNHFFNDSPLALSPNLIAGGLCVDGWLALFSNTELITDNSVISMSAKIFDLVDVNSYNYQFLSVSVFLYQFIWLTNDTSYSFDDKRAQMLQFEFDMLLTPAKLSKNLIVVRDTLLSTPEAFLLHILHNMLMINYYTLMVEDKYLGSMTSISAVPGLYHFISGMAISNFRVTVELVNRWSIIADCQILTAKLLLRLYNEMEFETFRFSLQFYTSRKNTNFDPEEYKMVDDHVNKFLESSQLKRDDDFDGAVVFWVFRDVRSMSLQLYINECKQRRRKSEDVDR